MYFDEKHAVDYGVDEAIMIANLAYCDDGEVVQNPRVLPEGFVDYPLPARDLLDLSQYQIPFCRRTPATTISTTCGCAHTCTFCPTQIWFQRTVRARPVPRVLCEIDELVDKAWKVLDQVAEQLGV